MGNVKTDRRYTPKKLNEYLQSEHDTIEQEMQDPNQWKQNEEFHSMVIMERRDRSSC